MNWKMHDRKAEIRAVFLSACISEYASCKHNLRLRLHLGAPLHNTTQFLRICGVPL